MIELQRKLLADAVRNDAFFLALKKVIKQGETTVVDLGSGTGFLAFLASKLGAKHITLIEVGEILETSKKLAKRNGVRNVTFIRKHSTEVKDIEKADVLISETLGNYALEENMIESIEDGKRFLKPGGIIIPGKVTQFVSPVISDRLPKDVDIWKDVGFDLDFNEAREIGQNNMYVKTFKPEDFGGKWKIEKQQSGSPTRGVEWDHIDFSKKNSSIRTKTLRWTAEAPLKVYGLGLWWDAELIPGVSISTSPFEKPTHWEQIFLPILETISLKAGETLELTLTSDTRWQTKVNLQWALKHLDASKKILSEQKMDMKKGYIM